MAQYSRPDADISDGGFSPSAGSDLYACLDDNDDADYITSAVAADDTCQVSAGTVTDPVSSSSHVLRARLRRSKATSSFNATLVLKQGTTTIATLSVTGVSNSITTYTYTLSSSEADLITDYSNLNFTLNSDYVSGSGAYLLCGWIELEVPDALTSLTVTPEAAISVTSSIAPSVVQGSIAVTPGQVSSIVSVVDPTTIQGSLTLTPVQAAGVVSTLAPAARLGSVTVTPALVATVASAIAPTVVQGSLALTPTQSASVAGAVAPTVLLGSPPITPNPAITVAATITPSVRLGSLTIAPALAAVVASSQAPAVVLGSLSVAPAQAATIAAAIPAAIILGSIAVTPGQAIAITLVIDPTVPLVGINVTPAEAIAIVSVVDPTIPASSLNVTPIAAVTVVTVPATLVIRVERLLMPGARILPPELKLGARTLLVDSQGNGDYLTVQSAIDAAVAAGADSSEPWMIRIAPGLYPEYLQLADYVDLSGLGYSPSSTVIKGPTAYPWQIIKLQGTTALHVTLSNLALDWNTAAATRGALITTENADHEITLWDCILGMNATELDVSAAQVIQGYLSLFNCDGHAKGQGGVVQINTSGHLYARNCHLYDEAGAGNPGWPVYVAAGNIAIYHTILEAVNGDSSSVAIYLDGACTGTVEFSVLRSIGTYSADKSGTPTAKLLTCLANKPVASGVPNAFLDVDALA